MQGTYGEPRFLKPETSNVGSLDSVGSCWEIGFVCLLKFKVRSTSSCVLTRLSVLILGHCFISWNLEKIARALDVGPTAYSPWLLDVKDAGQRMLVELDHVPGDLAKPPVHGGPCGETYPGAPNSPK